MSFLSLETIMEFIQHIFFQMTCMRESFPFVRGHYVRIRIEKEMYDPSQTVTVVFLPFLILQQTSPGPCWLKAFVWCNQLSITYPRKLDKPHKLWTFPRFTYHTEYNILWIRWWVQKRDVCNNRRSKGGPDRCSVTRGWGGGVKLKCQKKTSILRLCQWNSAWLLYNWPLLHLWGRMIRMKKKISPLFHI